MDQKPGHLKNNLSYSPVIWCWRSHPPALLHNFPCVKPLSSLLGYLLGISNLTCPKPNYWLLPPPPIFSLSLSLWANGNSILPIAQAQNLWIIQDSGFWTYVTFPLRFSRITVHEIMLPPQCYRTPIPGLFLILCFDWSTVSLPPYIVTSEAEGLILFPALSPIKQVLNICICWLRE